MRLIVGIIAGFFCVFSSIDSFAVHPFPTETVLSWPDIVDYAERTLPQEGRLVIKSDGYAYLKVDDDYIRTLFPMLGLKESGYREPPYFRFRDSPGAHISIFYKDENVHPKEESGETFHFTLKDIVIVHPSKDTSYAVLQVESKELEALRKKYGKGPKLHGHEFHISLARKRYR